MLYLIGIICLLGGAYLAFVDSLIRGLFLFLIGILFLAHTPTCAYPAGPLNGDVKTVCLEWDSDQQRCLRFGNEVLIDGEWRPFK